MRVSDDTIEKEMSRFYTDEAKVNNESDKSGPKRRQAFKQQRTGQSGRPLGSAT